jgi:hypothetical protein
MQPQNVRDLKLHSDFIHRISIEFVTRNKSIVYMKFSFQQMHYLLKIKYYNLRLNVHFSAPTCFGPLGPSSGSTHQNLAKVTKITVS